MNVTDLMNFIEYTITCIGVGIAIAQFFRHGTVGVTDGVAVAFFFVC